MEFSILAFLASQSDGQEYNHNVLHFASILRDLQPESLEKHLTLAFYCAADGYRKRDQNKL